MKEGEHEATARSSQ